MPVAERAHLSIGEVLSLLQEEFPDITISKIRFLESQGLLDPERTPSGYRKFYEPDIERLRWILVQQRENFLPLRVIKDRLSGDAPAPEPHGSAARATAHPWSHQHPCGRRIPLPGAPSPTPPPGRATRAPAAAEGCRLRARWTSGRAR